MIAELIQEVRSINGENLTFARTIDLDVSDGFGADWGIEDMLELDEDCPPLDDEDEVIAQHRSVIIRSIEIDSVEDTARVTAWPNGFLDWSDDTRDGFDDDEWGMPGHLAKTIYRDWTLRGQ